MKKHFPQQACFEFISNTEKYSYTYKFVSCNSTLNIIILERSYSNRIFKFLLLFLGYNYTVISECKDNIYKIILLKWEKNLIS